MKIISAILFWGLLADKQRSNASLFPDKLNVSIKSRFASVFLPKMINCLETLAVRNLFYTEKSASHAKLLLFCVFCVWAEICSRITDLLQKTGRGICKFLRWKMSNTPGGFLILLLQLFIKVKIDFT